MKWIVQNNIPHEKGIKNIILKNSSTKTRKKLKKGKINYFFHVKFWRIAHVFTRNPGRNLTYLTGMSFWNLSGILVTLWKKFSRYFWWFLFLNTSHTDKISKLKQIRTLHFWMSPTTQIFRICTIQTHKKKEEKNRRKNAI